MHVYQIFNALSPVTRLSIVISSLILAIFAFSVRRLLPAGSGRHLGLYVMRAHAFRALLHRIFLIAYFVTSIRCKSRETIHLV